MTENVTKIPSVSEFLAELKGTDSTPYNLQVNWDNLVHIAKTYEREYFTLAEYTEELRDGEIIRLRSLAVHLTVELLKNDPQSNGFSTTRFDEVFEHILDSLLGEDDDEEEDDKDSENPQN